MPYCDRCGAYIPDELSACLACGYDKDQETAKQAAAAAQAHREQEEKFAREEAEKRRAQRQAYERKWAEEELRRRQEEQEFRRRQAEQERRNREAEEAFSRRQQEAEARAESFVNSGRLHKIGNGAEQAVGKLIPALSYLGLLFLIPMIIGNDRFTKFHANQGLKLYIAGWILRGIGAIAWPIWAIGAVLKILLIITGIKNVLNGEEKPLPYIGNWF